MAEAGYYRSDGIQSSGTAITSNKDNVSIWVGGSKVYPRESTKTVSGSKFGGFALSSYRKVQGGSGTVSPNPKSGVAYQGAKSLYSSKWKPYYESWGFIKPASKPSDISAFKGIIEVLYVEGSYKPHRCGVHDIDRTLKFKITSDSKNNTEPTLLSNTWSLTLKKNKDSASSISFHSTDGDANDSLNKFFTKFIKEGRQIVLYNGENTKYDASYSDRTGWGSKNYAAIETFKINKIKIRYVS